MQSFTWFICSGSWNILTLEHLFIYQLWRRWFFRYYWTSALHFREFYQRTCCDIPLLASPFLFCNSTTPVCNASESQEADLSLVSLEDCIAKLEARCEQLEAINKIKTNTIDLLKAHTTTLEKRLERAEQYSKRPLPAHSWSSRSRKGLSWIQREGYGYCRRRS